MQIHVRANQQLKPFIRACIKRPHNDLLLIEFEPNPLLLGLKVEKLEKLPEVDRIAFYLAFNTPGVEARIELIPEHVSEEVFLYGPYFHRNEPAKPTYEGLTLVLTSEAFWYGNSDTVFL